jgi:hypothetical protein
MQNQHDSFKRQFQSCLIKISPVMRLIIGS